VFKCPGCSVAVWVNKNAESGEHFPANVDNDIYKEAVKQNGDKEEKEDKKI
jgi:alpha-amylase